MADTGLPRPVHAFEQTWMDRRFWKDLGKLSADEADHFLAQVKQLTRILSVSRHPTHDPKLRSFKPSSYKMGKLPDLYEYRIGGRGRVIAQHRTEEVLLLAATVSHDHKRIQRLLKAWKSGIASWTPPSAGA